MNEELLHSPDAHQSNHSESQQAATAVSPEAGRRLSVPFSAQGGSSFQIPLGSQPQAAPAYPTPAAPTTIEETGLTESLIEQLVVKHLYYKGEAMGRELSNALGLRYSVLEPVMETLKRSHTISAKRSMGMGNISSVFTLSEAGRTLARQYLETNSYAGVAPVTLDEYTTLVKAQSLTPGWLSKEALDAAYKHMVVSEEILGQIGPAVNSGKSFLIYGQPGNGKTFLAEALFNIQSTPIFIPYAIECQGQIIQVYDPVYHQPIDSPTETLSIFASAISENFPYDKRWFRSKRPFITTGGELTLQQLDLSFNHVSRVYDAPFQMRANNGIYLIDDFGRQQVSPAEVLNRWIVPMERKIDYLNFQQGGKITMPFECFLVFSTNLNPEQLGDEAFLRRIQYKMFLKSPNEAEYKEIFKQFCEKVQIDYTPGAIQRFLEKNYRTGKKKMRRCHPRDLITHAIDHIRFEKLPFHLTDQVLDHAFNSCFTTVNHFED